MGFLFDTLVHLLSSDPQAQQAAAARMVGTFLKVAPTPLPLDGERSFTVWHFPKVVARPFAVTVTCGRSTAGQPELLALSLADARGEVGARLARLLGTVADAEPGAEPLALPEGCLGRSSHRFAITCPVARSLRDHGEYERILGAPLRLVVPVTQREASWIEGHGQEAYADAMAEQGVQPYADRAPGETQLSELKGPAE